MSTGYPDGQKITQWIGSPIAQAAAAAIGAGQIVIGPTRLSSWASIIVALKPTGGTVTVTVKQEIPNGPAGLVHSQSVTVAAGATLFESFVLLGANVTITLQGSVGGTTVDYAVTPSNTTTNAQVIEGVANINGITGRLGLSVAPALLGGSGMSGVVRNGVGDYTVSYTVPFTAQPTVVATSFAGPNFVHIDLPGLGSQRFLTYNAAGALVDGLTIWFIAIATQ